MEYLNKIIEGDHIHILKSLPESFVDLIITSPPYGDLRDYNGYVFNYKDTANSLFRILKNGGVCVWIVGDKTENGSETLESLKQALYFKEIGFKVHDTMIYQKVGCPFPESNRYYQNWEYMFVFSKGKPKTFNPLLIKSNGNGNRKVTNTDRQKDGSTQRSDCYINEYHPKHNVWQYGSGYMQTTKDKYAYKHPAMFPENLAKDHILSWSNENDIILDPMCGSGTVCKMAKILNRKYIGIEISKEYCDIANKRVNDVIISNNLLNVFKENTLI